MKICACFTLAGGQGKTTTTFFLSLLLAAQGKRVLAVDANPQSDLTMYLGLTPSGTDATLLEVLNETIKPELGVYATRVNNLCVIPSDSNLSKIAPYLIDSGAGAYILRRRLDSLQGLFDYVLIDTQPTRSQICATVVGAADRIVIPFEANTKGVNSVVDSMEYLKMQAGFRTFNGTLAGVIPFRDRWFGRAQSVESRDAIAIAKNLLPADQIFPSIIESERFKTALRHGRRLKDMGYSDLEYPFEKILEAL